MESLVLNYNGKPCTNSRLVADKFTKRHSDVLRAIDNLECSKHFFERNFALVKTNELDNPSPIINEGREFMISRDGFSFLVMGFTGKEAAKFKEDFILAFNYMESLIHSNVQSLSKKDIAKMLLESEEEKERLQEKIKQSEPKVLFADSVTASDDSILVGQLAKIIKQNGREIGQNRLFEYLRDNNNLGTRGDNYNLPTQKSMALGLFKIVELTIDTPQGSKLQRSIRVTGKGQVYFTNRFLGKN